MKKNKIVMKNKIVSYLEKIIPAEDKLKHSFLGDIAYLTLLVFNLLVSIFFSFLTPIWVISLIVLLISSWWEYEQKKDGGGNSKKEIFWDLFWGNVKHVIITISWLILN